MRTVEIPRGALLIAEGGAQMIVRDGGSADVIGLSGDALQVRFEDGQDYTVERAELRTKTRGWHAGLGPNPNHQESR
jgi:hypothetical protein